MVLTHCAEAGIVGVVVCLTVYFGSEGILMRKSGENAVVPMLLLTARYLEASTDALATCWLTTDHSSSSHGVPVLCLADDVAYGPNDLLPHGQRDHTAGDLVRRLRNGFRLEDEADSKFDEDRYDDTAIRAINHTIDTFLGQ